MALSIEPIAKTHMLIRSPTATVFDAFIDPAITTKFWFSKSSGTLRPGEMVRWDWEMYNVSTEVTVLEVEPHRRIRIEWDNPATPVEWVFDSYSSNSTFVTIATWGFHGSEDEKVAQAMDAVGGFSLVLAGLKAWLEHGITLQLVADHCPPTPSLQPGRT